MRVAVTILLLLTVACSSSTMVVDTLYFGTEVNGHPEVEDAEWTQFLEEVVSPRFPGFTTWKAVGHWKSNPEDTHVLQIAFDPTRENEMKIVEIVHEYRRRFRQEAVMRVRGRSQVTF